MHLPILGKATGLRTLCRLRLRSLPLCRSMNTVLTQALTNDTSNAARMAALVPNTTRVVTFLTRPFLVIGMQKGFSRTFGEPGACPRRSSDFGHARTRAVNDPGTQQGQTGPAVHLAFDHLEPIDVAFHRAVAPLLLQRCSYGCLVLADALGEALKLRTHRAAAFSNQMASDTSDCLRTIAANSSASVSTS